jgi:hypothetical protein
LGWALVGACPGPIFILLGAGFGVFWLFFWSASWDVYGVLKINYPINWY